ncbi:MAG: VWA domain-containing protein [Leptospiraceae bacterium]|nr:VWA domain-containing protein [Leptospiraceae bacterium]
MEWDQKLFQLLWRKFKTQALPTPKTGPYATLAHLLCGHGMQVAFVFDTGGFSKDFIYLPSLAYLCTQSSALKKRMGSTSKNPGWQPENTSSQSIACNKTLHSLYIFRILSAALYMEGRHKDHLLAEKWQDMYHKLHDELYQLQLLPELESRQLESADKSSETQDLSAEIPTGSSEQDVESNSQIQNVTEDKKAVEEYTLNHSFEKIETLEEFNGNWRDLDGSDQIKEQQDALSELKFNQMVRSTEETHGFLKSKQGQGTILELGGETKAQFQYPEWDYRKKIFKERYCSVSQEQIIGSVTAASNIIKKRKHTLNRLKQDLGRFYNRFHPQKAQSDGTGLDLDAVVDYLIDRRIGLVPSEKLYVRKLRVQRELDLLLLLDASLSTDSYKMGIQVLEAQKESVLLFGEALQHMRLDFRCYAFSSKTRHHVRIATIHSPGDLWKKSREALLGLQPSGYTRIGPALRHCSEILRKSSSHHRWIVLFTDGQPNDFDRYEGRYGNEDVQHAILEAEASGIGVHLLSFAPRQQLFGHFCQSALDLKILPQLLMQFYGRVLG